MRYKIPFLVALGGCVLLVNLLSSSAFPQKMPFPNGGALFQTADSCMACHNNLTTPSGEDVSIGFNWRASMMANSARDPYWQAAVRREVMDFPIAQAAIEDECSKCHMPMARFEAKATGGAGAVFANLGADLQEPRRGLLAADGVSCTVCHQITEDGLGHRDSFVGNFSVDTTRPEGERTIFGPFEVDRGRTAIMRSATGFQPTEASHLRQSEICATCHTLYTHALSPGGEVLGELPEQVPYQEWLHSSFRGEKSCQDCHMSAVREPMPISSVLGEPREGLARHDFRGGNFFMLRMLNRYRNDLDVEALPQELEIAARKAVEFLQSESASVSVEHAEVQGGFLEAEVSVVNLAGHKLPTAYPSRRAWLHVTVRDGNDRVVFESGVLTAQGLIQGNDNDSDPARHEPHYEEIRSSEQVQIYESNLVNQAGAVTTGLLSGVRYVKDNRLQPRGFDKETAEPDITAHGLAAADADFSGGSDKVRYVVDVTGAEPSLEESETLQMCFPPIWYAQVVCETDRSCIFCFNALIPSSPLRSPEK